MEVETSHGTLLIPDELLKWETDEEYLGLLWEKLKEHMAKPLDDETRPYWAHKVLE